VTCDSCSYGVRVQQGAAKLWVSQFRNNGFGISCNSSSRYFFPPDICPDFVLCEVSYNSFSGVILDDSSPIINGCDISHNGAWGLKCLDDSDPILGENDLKSNRESSKLCKNNGSLKSGPPQMDGGGLFCSGTSCPIVCDGPVMGSYKRGWNVITDNDGDGVYCTGQSAPKLGRGWHIHEGQNSLGDNARYDVYNSTGSMVWAEYNWWGDANGPDTAKIYGSVDWDPYLDEEPSKGKTSGGSGHLALLGLLTRPKTRETLGTKTKGQDPDSTGTAEEYNELGTYYLLQMMYDEAIEAFQYVLTNFSDCVDALVHLMHCYREGGYQADIFPYLQNLSSISLNPELKNLALYMSVSQLSRDGQYGQALNRCQVLLAAGCDEEMEKSLRLREGMLYRYGLDDDETAIAVFQDFITRYSEDPLTSIAQVELEILGVYQPPKAAPGAPATKPTVPLPKSFVLYQNYPNPFNARTCIEYELPRDVRVTLKVYNVLGQQIKTLANDFHHAGHYKVFWDGRNSMGSEIASGIYFIRLEAGTYALTRKTVLLR
jgi:tetratricopeptide (TPR) repeat protein